MNLVDALVEVSRKRPVTFLLEGRQAHVDEVINEQGFMPVLAMIADRRMKRLFAGSELTSGFSYVPDEIATFGQKLVVEEAGKGLHSDAIRLAVLVLTAEEILGLDVVGVVDLTPVFDQFFSSMDVSGASDREPMTWPPYTVVSQ